MLSMVPTKTKVRSADVARITVAIAAICAVIAVLNRDWIAAGITVVIGVASAFRWLRAKEPPR